MDVALVDDESIHSDPCPICYQDLSPLGHDTTQDVIQTECHHKYHRKCLLDWLTKSSPEFALNRTCICPICLREVTENYILTAPGNDQAPPNHLRLRLCRLLIQRLITLSIKFVLIWTLTFLPILILTYGYQAISWIVHTEHDWIREEWNVIKRLLYVEEEISLIFLDSQTLGRTKALILKICGYDTFTHIFIPESTQFLAYAYLDLVWYILVVGISQMMYQIIGHWIVHLVERAQEGIGWGIRILLGR